MKTAKRNNGKTLEPDIYNMASENAIMKNRETLKENELMDNKDICVERRDGDQLGWVAVNNNTCWRSRVINFPWRNCTR